MPVATFSPKFPDALLTGSVRVARTLRCAACGAALFCAFAAPGAAMDTGAAAAVSGVTGFATTLRPPARDGNVPRTRWEHQVNHVLWNRAALSALKSHGRPLTEMVPEDIATWCPQYPAQDAAGRRAFWLGFMSALAKHESTYRAQAVGGGGKWYGLLQILPATARGYRCTVGTGEALKNGAANLSCAVRIMAVTVPRDGVIHRKDRRWRGVSADWGPMRSEAKRRDMARWLKQQPYCQRLDALRPRPAPVTRP